MCQLRSKGDDLKSTPLGFILTFIIIYYIIIYYNYKYFTFRIIYYLISYLIIWRKSKSLKKGINVKDVGISGFHERKIMCLKSVQSVKVLGGMFLRRSDSS